MIPTHSGTITLPAVEYTWFDTTRGEVRTSTLPATTIHVAEDPDARAQIPPMVVSPSIEPEAGKATECPEPSIISSVPDNTAMRLWQGLTTLFALLWLLTLGIWRFKSGSGKQADSHETIIGDHHPAQNQAQEAAAFSRLETTCQQKNVRQILNELQNWSRVYLKDEQLTSLPDCLNQLGSSKLKATCNKLAGSLYSAEPAAADIQGLLNTLLEECRRIRTENPEKDNNQELGELYPQ